MEDFKASLGFVFLGCVVPVFSIVAIVFAIAGAIRWVTS